MDIKYILEMVGNIVGGFMKGFLTVILIFGLVLTLTSCGKNNGKISPSFKETKENEISKETQIITLNNSADYYIMNIKQDVNCVYFYSIGYDDRGNLIDKSIITTMPVGMSSDDEVAINATIPKASEPSYAIGFSYDEKGMEYYTINKNDKGKIIFSLITEKEAFLIQED